MQVFNMENPMVALFASLPPIILVLITNNLFPELQQPANQVRTPKQLCHDYDYIIIGAGSAGSVLAARLSEDETKTVLVLEAGYEEDELVYSNIPRAAPLLLGSKIDWGFSTGPEKNCCTSLNGSRIHLAQGKVLGGGSGINWMLYGRGHPSDYDHWAELGNGGWSYEEVLPFFIKSERAQFLGVNTSIHGLNGPLPVTRGDPGAFTETLFEAAKSINLSILEDMTGGETNGFGLPLFTAFKGERQSTARTYLRPAMDRDNLHVVTEAVVNKILFESYSSKPKASGVEFQWRDGKKRKIKAKNIILSAGAISSPKLLMLSGIGPSEVLKSQNIPVLVDHPAVGEHLADHPGVLLFYTINKTLEDADQASFLKSFYMYLSSRQSNLADSFVNAVGYIRSGLNSNFKGNDIEISVVSDIPPESLIAAMKVLNYEQDYIDKVKSAIDEQGNRTTILFLVTLLHPNSTGNIKLESCDNEVKPQIVENFFDNDHDAKVIAYGMKLVTRLIDSKPFQSYDPKLIDSPVQGCDHSPHLIDEYLVCLAKKLAISNFHPSSSCRMGKDRKDSVVNANNLKVHDVDGLYVVDTSIFPMIVGGHMNAPVIMLAEKAADMIKSQNI